MKLSVKLCSISHSRVFRIPIQLNNNCASFGAVYRATPDTMYTSYMHKYAIKVISAERLNLIRHEPTICMPPQFHVARNDHHHHHFNAGLANVNCLCAWQGIERGRWSRHRRWWYIETHLVSCEVVFVSDYQRRDYVDAQKKSQTYFSIGDTNTTSDDVCPTKRKTLPKKPICDLQQFRHSRTKNPNRNPKTIQSKSLVLSNVFCGTHK